MNSSNRFRYDPRLGWEAWLLLATVSSDECWFDRRRKCLVSADLEKSREGLVWVQAVHSSGAWFCNHHFLRRLNAMEAIALSAK